MSFYADLHIHSKYSRATSRDCDVEHLAWWAQRKGVTVVGTGDFTHPAWFEELQRTLVPAEPGLFRLRDDLDRAVTARLPTSCRGPVRFMLSVEISTIYKRAERTRKVHHLVYAPDFDTARAFNRRLGSIGNMTSDGRPILGLDSRDLLEITLESGDGAYLVPAHVWTPWFAALGSKSGFDAVEDCYADLASHIFAVETGLSSDPLMNWRVSGLDRYRLVSNSDAHSPPALGREATVFDTAIDYSGIRRALETGEGFGGTIEFFPEEGKYHLDGHRKCGVRLDPAQTRERQGSCPACGSAATVGVLHRVEALADRSAGARPEGAAPFRSLVPLPEIVGELLGVGAKSKTVARTVDGLVGRLGPELAILTEVPLDEVERAGSSLLAEAVRRLRAGAVRREAGYDGEYGVIRMFEPAELQGALFEPAEAAPPVCVQPIAEPAAPVLDAVPAEGLDPDQGAAAAITDGPLLIVAGPGTGKTRTLTHRLAHLVSQRGVPAGRCLVITFTRRACQELRERLEALIPAAAQQVAVVTFHELGLRILREQHRRVGLPERFGIADEAVRLDVVRQLQGGSQRQAARAAEALSRQKRASASSEELDRYDAALRGRGLVDLDDLLALPMALLAADPALAGQYRDRYQWIAVDEYQDVDELQYRLLRLLAPPDGNLCAIGDPDQAIYGFRGSDVGFFLRFRTDFPTAHTVQLTRNYRSSATIVGGALQAIAPSTFVPDRRLTAVRTAASSITLHHAPSEHSEAEFVARTIDELLGGSSFYSLDSSRVDVNAGAGGLSFADIAVLYRTDAQSEPLVEALVRAGMPFQKRSHDRLLDRPGVRPIVALLDRAERTDLPVLERVRRAAAAVVEQPADVGPALDLLEPLAEKCAADLPRFLAELALGVQVDTWDPRADRVSLLTLHAAKGLEFPVVFLVGCEDGLLPLRWGAGDDQDESEERRLFFVGMTRAQSHLFLSHARRRTRHGQVRDATPSPFLSAISPSLLQQRTWVTRRAAPAASPVGDQLRLL